MLHADIVVWRSLKIDPLEMKTQIKYSLLVPQTDVVASVISFLYFYWTQFHSILSSRNPKNLLCLAPVFSIFLLTSPGSLFEEIKIQFMLANLFAGQWINRLWLVFFIYLPSNHVQSSADASIQPQKLTFCVFPGGTAFLSWKFPSSSL